MIKNFTLLIIAVLLSVYLSCVRTESTFEEEEEGPGWYEQWFEMKKDASGHIPEMMSHQWALKDAALRKTNASSFLDSVKVVGPDNVGGRTRAIVVDWADTTHYFSGSVAGGLWESKNEGATWSPVNDNQENLNITSITQSPFDPNIYYYCTGEPYPIADASSNTGGQLGGGIFKSTDGGKTFAVLASTLNSNFTTTWDIKHSLKDTNTIYVSTDNKGMFRSTDGGLTFTNIFATTSAITHIEVLDDGSVFMSCNSNGIYKSPDGSPGSFVKLSNGFATGSYGRIEFSICKNFPNVMLAVVSTSSNAGIFGTYKTSNGGTSWRTITNANVGYGYTWFCLATAICPTDTNKMFIGSVSLGYSLNSGTSWTVSNSINSHADYHRFVTVHSSRKLLCGNDGGIYRYNWGTPGPFVSLNNAYRVTQYYSGSFFKTGLSVIMGAQDNGSHRILNGGKNAFSLFGADGSFNGINQQDDNRGFFSYQSGNVYRANNLKGTPTTTLISSPGNAWFINPIDINPADGSQLYFASKSAVYRNTGTTYTAITLAQSKQPYALGISAEVNPTVYFGGSAMLLKRIDSALTTTSGKEKDLTATKPAALTTDFIGSIKVHPNDKNTIFLTMTNYNAQPRVWKVSNTNGTPVWTSISGDLPTSLPCNSIEVDPAFPDTKMMVGTDFGLYVTDDGGVTWVKETQIPNVCIYSIKLRSYDRRLFVFTHGRGVWVANVMPYAIAKPDADFVVSVTQACEGEAVSFSDQSTNAPSQFLWAFEGGSPATSTMNSPVVSFTGAGVKKIKLITSNTFGSDSVEKTIQILANPKPVLIRTGYQVQSSITASAYFWYRNNSLIAPQTQVITADQTGWYKVRVDNGNGCFATSDSVLMFGVGITPVEENTGFVFYPNPAGQYLNAYSLTDATLKIYTLNGSLAASFSIGAKAADRLDVSNLARGVYLLVYSNDRLTKEYKFVKQ